MKNVAKDSLPLPFSMKGIKVIGISKRNGSFTIRIIKDLEFGICPCCGTLSQKKKDCHIHSVKDRPAVHLKIKIEVVKRRWKCVNDFCDLQTFTEELDGLPRNRAHTEQFYKDVYQLSRKMTYTGVRRHLIENYDCKVGIATVYRASQELIRESVVIPEHVEVSFIGLDEFSKGKNHDYGVVLVDLVKRKVIDVADGGKTKKAALSLLAKLDQDKVKACAIDMWKPFRAACLTLPNAVVVIDRFHVIKTVNEAMDKVRKRVRKHLKSKARKKALFEYKELFRMGAEKLSEKQHSRLWKILSWNKDLIRTYELKEILRDIYFGENHEKARKQLNNWIKETETCGIPEITEAGSTISNWKLEILNFWHYRITNAVTEGKVNKIKTLRRQAYNYNNFESLRLKILEIEQ